MSSELLPVAAYLHRVGLSTMPEVNESGLFELVRAQSLAIAFENLDVLAGQQISVDRKSIVDKILIHGRGGYCYELNGLMALALATAGFNVSSILSRVTYRRPEAGPLTHQLLQVNLGSDVWLVDVGFGGPGLIEPVRRDERGEFEQAGARFRLFEEQDGDLHLQRYIDGAWSGLYRISSVAARHGDIEMANHFICTYPYSPFRNRFMCVQPLADGYWSFDGCDLVRVDGEHRVAERIVLHSASDLLHVMRHTFKIELSSDIAARAWMKVTGEKGQLK